MKKTLKIISIAVGIISVLSTVVLGCVYFESISEYIKGKLERKRTEI